MIWTKASIDHKTYLLSLVSIDINDGFGKNIYYTKHKFKLIKINIKNITIKPEKYFLCVLSN